MTTTGRHVLPRRTSPVAVISAAALLVMFSELSSLVPCH